MMTFGAGCGYLVHVNATSQNSACVFVQGRQFTANCYTGMADLATVVSQALGIKFYGVPLTAYHGHRFSFRLELHNP